MSVYSNNQVFFSHIVPRIDRCVTGLPDGTFQTKNPNLGKFWRALEWKSLLHSIATWNMYVFYGRLIYFRAICYIL
jgi:hypothetical protein